MSLVAKVQITLHLNTNKRTLAIPPTPEIIFLVRSFWETTNFGQISISILITLKVISQSIFANHVFSQNAGTFGMQQHRLLHFFIQFDGVAA